MDCRIKPGNDAELDPIRPESARKIAKLQPLRSFRVSPQGARLVKYND
jgi:hypothetical protein